MTVVNFYNWQWECVKSGIMLCVKTKKKTDSNVRPINSDINYAEWMLICGHCFFLVNVVGFSWMHNQSKKKNRGIEAAAHSEYTMRNVRFIEPNQRVFFAVRPRYAGEKCTILKCDLVVSEIQKSSACVTKTSHLMRVLAVYVFCPDISREIKTNRFSRRRKPRRRRKRVTAMRGAAR